MIFLYRNKSNRSIETLILKVRTNIQTDKFDLCDISFLKTFQFLESVLNDNLGILAFTEVELSRRFRLFMEL